MKGLEKVKKILIKSQENFEKSQENFSKKSGKISQLDLWQPCTSQLTTAPCFFKLRFVL